ncbi:MAG: hypothetical protein ACI30R_05885 [Sodaliphilus sp.]
MKKINLLVCLLIAFASHAFAADLTPSQEKAQRALYAYLDKNKFNPEVDTDNSVCFRKDGVLYWINIDEESPILFTFQRKGFKVGTDDSSFKRRPAILAANEVNCKHNAVKLKVTEKRVEIAMQVYIEKAEDFTAVFNEYLKCFDEVDQDFKQAYSAAVKAEREEAERIEREALKNLPPSVLRDFVKSMSFRLLDASGNVTTPYDQPLRSFKARYIQARIEFLPWKEKEAKFNLQIKVTRPNGNPIYIKGKKCTAEGEITLQKSKKNQLFEISEFGSEKEGFWKAGEYKVELIESGDVIYTTTFNIL